MGKGRHKKPKSSIPQREATHLNRLQAIDDNKLISSPKVKVTKLNKMTEADDSSGEDKDSSISQNVNRNIQKKEQLPKISDAEEQNYSTQELMELYEKYQKRHNKGDAEKVKRCKEAIIAKSNIQEKKLKEQAKIQKEQEEIIKQLRDHDNSSIAKDTNRLQRKQTKKKSLPQHIELTPFSETVSQQMSKEELMDQLFRHLKKHNPENDEEAQRYSDYLLTADYTTEEIEMKEAEAQTEQTGPDEEKTKLKQKIEELESALKEQREKQERDSIRPSKIRERLLENINYVEKVDLTEKEQQIRQNLKQDVKTLLEILEKRESDIRELKEENQKQQQYIENIHQENSTKASIQRILENFQSKLQENLMGNKGRAEELEEHTNEKTQFSNTETAIQDYTGSQTPLYSDMLNKMGKNPKLTSESAILLKKLPSTKMSINTIRNILNVETKNNQNLPRIYCETSRSRNTLIIKSVSEDETEKLLHIIERVEKLRDITELTFRTSNQKKIIILGIPSIIQPEDIIKKITKDIGVNVPVHIHRKLQKENSHQYQLVLETNITIAYNLIKLGRLLVGFNSCKISDYKPIIRCAHCQRYGHTKDNCSYEAACAICAYNHETTACPNKDIPSKTCCINCLDTRNNFPHKADSSKCPLYQYKLKSRINSINTSTSRSK